jgi:Cysteine-rich secretory protein family
MKSVSPSIVLLLVCAGFVSAAEEPTKVRTADEVKKKLAEIMATVDGVSGERDAALRRLNAYRYLAGVPYDIRLNDEFNAVSDAAARLCAKLGRIDHTPANPGLPENDYKLGFKGTSRSNLAQGYGSLQQAIDGWIDDSDKFNVSRLGHRRWCFNPAMQETGFGRIGQFTAMYTLDNGREKAPDYDFLSWPPRGPVPVEFFNKQSAWSVTLNTRKYNPANEAVTTRIYATDKNANKTGTPLPLSISGSNTERFGIPNCIIFQLEEVEIAPGNRYVVEIDGLTRGQEMTMAVIRFAVEFISLK